jgi:hypothetical protein
MFILEIGSTQNSNNKLLCHQFHIDILVSITKLQKHNKIQSTVTYNKVLTTFILFSTTDHTYMSNQRLKDVLQDASQYTAAMHSSHNKGIEHPETKFNIIIWNKHRCDQTNEQVKTRQFSICILSRFTFILIL